MSGAVTLPVEIGGQTYSLMFKFGSMRLAEQELGKPIGEVLNGGGLGLEAISALFWAALQPNHRMTREGADNLVDLAGVEAVARWISEGISRYFGKGDSPAPEEEGKPGKAAGERKSAKG